MCRLAGAVGCVMSFKVWGFLAVCTAIVLVIALHRTAVTASYLRGYAEAKADSTELWTKAVQVQQQQLQAEFKRQLTNANNAVTALRAANRDIAQRELLLRQEIDYVTTHYRQSPAAQPEPLPACIFTNGFVGVYNRAISPGGAASAAMPAADTAAGTNTAASASATAATTEDALRPSNIRQRDILHHIAEYGSRCQSIEAQLNQLLDYLESINRGKTDGS